MNDREIVDLVRKYLKDCHPAGVTIDALDEGIMRDGDWWYISVRPDHQFARTYEYYEALTQIENEIKQKEHLDVMLIPAA